MDVVGLKKSKHAKISKDSKTCIVGKLMEVQLSTSTPVIISITCRKEGNRFRILRQGNYNCPNPQQGSLEGKEKRSSLLCLNYSDTTSDSNATRWECQICSTIKFSTLYAKTNETLSRKRSRCANRCLF